MIYIPRTKYIAQSEKLKRRRPRYLLTKTEIRQIEQLRPKKTLGRAERLEALSQYKLKKWEKRNPRPPEDLFVKQYIKDWEEAREKALQDIRDFVVSVHYKLTLYGRYKLSEDKFTNYDVRIATIKDKTQEFKMTKTPIERTTSLYKRALRIVNNERRLHPNLVAASLTDYKRSIERLIIPNIYVKAA